MKLNSDNILKLGMWVLCLGLLFIVFAPFLFTRNWSYNWLGISFETTGQIGDTIGGITAPIVNAMGAILVFCALYAQIEANKIIQRQIDEQKNDELERKNFSSLNEVYKLIKEDFDSFTYTKDETTGSITKILMGDIPRNFVTYVGREAFEKYIQEIIVRKCEEKDESTFFETPKYKSFFDFIKVFEILTKRINSTKIAPLDKETLLALMKILFNSRLMPFLDFEVECPRCYKKHDKLPQKLTELLNNIKENLGLS